MTAVARLVTRSLVLVGLLSAAITPPPQAGAPAATSAAEQAVVRAEVRLRKLHLVRPDLIPYPIAYEVVC
jgi:hypothetical protein